MTTVLVTAGPVWNLFRAAPNTSDEGNVVERDSATLPPKSGGGPSSTAVADIDTPTLAAERIQPPEFVNTTAAQQATMTSVVIDQRNKLPTGDAGEEGWQSEAFSEAASQRLGQFAKWLAEADVLDETALGEWCHADATARLFDADSLPIEFQDELVTVARGKAAAIALTERPPRELNLASIAHALQARRASWHHARHAKFKLYRVAIDGHNATTEQFVHLSGSATGQTREYNSTWRFAWSQRDASQPPKIHRIEEERIEVVTAKRQQQPWLADCTASLMSAVPSYESEWLNSIPHWLTRLEAAQGVYNFGYHGVAIADVNSDGLDDVYLCQTGGLPNRLLLQRLDGTLEDVSAAAGVDYLDNTRAALFIDLDNDADQDLVLTTASGVILLENDGQLRYRPRARINSIRHGFSLAAADFDQDGQLDIYVCVYYGDNDAASELPLPLPYFDARNGGANHLIRNEGDWKFTDATEPAGLGDENFRFSFAATWDDIDNDSDLDLLVVNDFGPNQLYENEAGHFRNVANQNGLLDGAFGMSATIGDYDRDGRDDIYVSNMFSAAGNRVTTQPNFKSTEDAATREKFQRLARGNSLFRNRGDGTFDDTSVDMNVTMGRWSWGSLFVDLDNNGWDDLLVANGFVTGQQTDDL
ncbi:MAG: VCBS repeat-containing protein [Planctomycetales bacterium]|nr:VCBS repeat-containing protein [Planctomycetales bacterium]